MACVSTTRTTMASVTKMKFPVAPMNRHATTTAKPQKTTEGALKWTSAASAEEMAFLRDSVTARATSSTWSAFAAVIAERCGHRRHRDDVEDCIGPTSAASATVLARSMRMF